MKVMTAAKLATSHEPHFTLSLVSCFPAAAEPAEPHSARLCSFRDLKIFSSFIFAFLENQYPYHTRFAFLH